MKNRPKETLLSKMHPTIYWSLLHLPSATGGKTAGDTRGRPVIRGVTGGTPGWIGLHPAPLADISAACAAPFGEGGAKGAPKGQLERAHPEVWG